MNSPLPSGRNSWQPSSPSRIRVCAVVRENQRAALHVGVGREQGRGVPARGRRGRAPRHGSVMRRRARRPPHKSSRTTHINTLSARKQKKSLLSISIPPSVSLPHPWKCHPYIYVTETKENGGSQIKVGRSFESSIPLACVLPRRGLPQRLQLRLQSVEHHISRPRKTTSVA